MADFANLVIGLDTSGLKRGERDVKSFGKTSKAMNGAIVSATRALALFGGAFAAARAVSSASQAYASMANSMRVLGFEADDVAAKINQIGEISKRTRSPLEATAQLYQRISIAAKDLGASQQQVLRFTENVGLALAQQGGSAAQASGALLQLSQAMSGGTVRAEEFNSILEGAFPIAQAAANAIEGAAGSVGQLRNMVIAGEVSSREFFNAILSSSEALEAAFGNTVPTVSQALTVLSTSFTLFVGQADSFLGASSALAEVIILLSGNLEFLAGVVSVAAVAFGVRYVAAMVTARLATFSLIGALQGLKAALISTGIGVVIVGLGLVVGQLIKARAQTESFGDTFRMVALQVKAASLNMKAYFISALGSMAYEFIEFTYVVADGINSLFGTNLMGASAEITQNLNKAFLETEAAAYAATAAANALKITIAETSDESDGTAAALDKLAAGAKSAAGGVDKLTPALTDAEKATQSYADTMQGFIVDGIGKAVDNMVDGFTGGLKSIKDIFVATIKQMISFAIKNKIMLSLGMGGSAMGTAASAATGGAGGLGGSLAGIGSLGSVFAGSLSGTASAFMSGGIGAGVGQIGATLGAVTGSLGSLAAAAGAIALPLLAVVGVFKFFGKSTKLLDQGLQLTVKGMNSVVESFSKTKTSRFFGLSSRTSTSTSQLDAAAASPLTNAIDGIQKSVLSAAAGLGIGADAFSKFSFGFRISLNGLTEEQKMSAVTAELAKMGDAFAAVVPGISSLNELLAVSSERYNLQNRVLELQGKGEELLARQRKAQMNATNDLNKAILKQIFNLEDASIAQEKTNALAEEAAKAAAQAQAALFSSINENDFATGVDFRRGLARASSGIEYSPQQSQAEMLAELKALNARIDMLQSTSEITANSSRQTAENTDFSNALTLDAAA